MPGLPFRFFLPVILLFCLLSSCGAAEDDLATIRDRYRTAILGGGVNRGAIENAMRRLSPEGTWKDVDYADKTRGGWRTYNHLTRVLTLTKAWASPTSPLHHDAPLLEKTLTALRHWLDKDYQCPNWWYNRIAVPRAMGDIMLLLEGKLGEKGREKALEIVTRGKFGMTGQNSVWVAGITFVRALIENDADLVRRAREIILKDLVVTTKEGLQPDASFHQHGPQQQFGNYGLSFIRDMAFWGNVWNETPFALTEEQVRLLRFYMLDGLAWTVYRGRMDISSCGRQVFKNSPVGKAKSVIHACRLLERLDPKCADAYHKVAVANEKPPYPPSDQDGIRNFWRSDYFVQKTPRFLVSLKMHSTRTIGCETCNAENMQGRLLADGATYIYVEGDEYENIMPVWNWRRLPGITAVPATEGSLVPRNKRGTTEFVGGLTVDGKTAAAAMDFARDSLTAKKAWFFLGDHVVCLGAGISCEKESPVDTTLNQTRLKGDVVVATRGQIKAAPWGKETDAEGVTGIWHNRTAYRFFHPTKTRVSVKEQVGDWKRIRSAYPDTRVAMRVFAAWLEHGKRPRDAKYAYVITPDCESDVVERMIENEIRLLVNETTVQAVCDLRNDRLFAVFYTAGEAKCGDETMTADRPCIVIVEGFSGPGKRRITVGDPTRKLEAVTLRLGGEEEKFVFLRGERQPHQVSQTL